MTTKFLMKNDGSLYIYSDVLAKRKDMTPYDPPTDPVVAPEPVEQIAVVEIAPVVDTPEILTAHYLRGLTGGEGKRLMSAIALERFGVTYFEPTATKSDMIASLLELQRAETN